MHDVNSQDSRQARITRRLREGLDPVELTVIDESHKHIGHAGAKDGRGHFRVRVRASALAGMKSLQIHRKIYALLGDLMQTDIHAVSLDAAAPEESDQLHPRG